ncbi:MAG: DUF805 domain-containing protein, partial [Negativicutes bacterium]|nr:DUF805 domain-containing protein [Negativicutes bacterium]
MKFFTYLQQDFLTFSGRVNRIHYLYVNIIFYLFVISLHRFLVFYSFPENKIMLIFILLFTLALFITNISIKIRRLADLNKSPYYLLLNFIPFIHLFFEIYLLTFKGTSDTNKYGAIPNS